VSEIGRKLTCLRTRISGYSMSASESKADVQTESRSLTSHNGEKRAQSGNWAGIFSASSECLRVAVEQQSMRISDALIR